MTEAKGQNDWKESWAKACRHPPEARKGKETSFALEPPEGTILAHTLTLAPWTDGLGASIAARE